MKQGFLFGIAGFFVLAIHFGLGQINKSETVAGVLIIMTCLPLCVLAIRAGIAAPPHLSRLHAVAGWLAGVLCMPVAILVVAGITLSLG